MPAPRQPTLEEVAAHAGVGRGTASRAINGARDVSPRARAAVAKAVQELGYVPNAAARSLVTRRTGAIALVIPEPERRIFGQPYFAGIVRGSTSVIAAAGRQMVLPLVQPGDRRALDQFLSPQHVDGVILMSQHASDGLAGAIIERGVPLVHGGRPADGSQCSFVDVDNVGGAQRGVEHLLARGRRRIAVITGREDSTHSMDRLQGYRTALLEHGLEPDDSLRSVGDFDEVSGVLGMRELLERRPDLDAVFAFNDSMALGALRVLQERGVSVPEQVAVLGFDDAEAAALAEPALSTIAQPTEDVGRELGRLLLATLDDGASGVEAVVLPTELRVRDST